MKQSITGLEALAPIKRETSQDRVYGQLRTALIRGGFEAGALFIVSDMAKRMSVSSMPVREALARLVSEGALEAMPNRRVRVPLLTIARARGIRDARVLIEGELAALALPNLTNSSIARFEEKIEEYEAMEEAGDVVRANQAFHFSIYAHAGSPVLLPFVESLWMQGGPYIRAAARVHGSLLTTSSSKHHHGIVKAMRKRDANALRAELTADISQGFAILENAGEAFWKSDEGSSND